MGDTLLLLVGLIGVLVAILVLVAQLRLFSIDRTLIAILTEMRIDNRATANAMKMILFELRREGLPPDDTRQE